MKIRIAGYIPESTVDGEGVRLAIFTQGCPHRCNGCQNPQTWDYGGGRVADTKDFDRLMANPLLSGITLTGGEPFLQQEACIKLADMAHRRGLNVWCYTGYEFETLRLAVNYREDRLIEHIDILVDGRFELSKRSLNLLFRGSSNQRIIDVKKSLSGKEVVLYDRQ